MIITKNSPFFDSLTIKKNPHVPGEEFEKLLSELKNVPIENILAENIVSNRSQIRKAIWYIEKCLETKEECQKVVVESVQQDFNENNLIVILEDNL